MRRLCVAGKLAEALALVYAHVLSEVIVTTEVLAASFNGALVRCKSKSESRKQNKSELLTFLIGVDGSHMPL